MEDDVDRLIAAWQHERPDLDVSPMHVLSRVTRLALHLDRARKDAFEDQGLEPSEFDVLSALRRAGEPYQLSPGQLVQETLVTSGTMTNRVDRLVRKELVDRLPDPADRRGVQVRLTSQGREAVDGALDALLMAEKKLLAGLTPAEATQLADALRKLSQPFDR
ncbi:MarR family transcriptional regulator [Aeromicrobium sp. S22]|uniref:MarR family winged helix-turn-helix transcriptional regulator n=1 Tax=Aeromicrobium sp. S22 TaxID=2662029 RepID=UPI00129EE345|nr:MarR family transcriptional regulator [Aeromicrobium sp. S22]MRK00801.1 MarR family transcriptional regulator [Aeromicrobium sp. S22]